MKVKLYVKNNIILKIKTSAAKVFKGLTEHFSKYSREAVAEHAHDSGCKAESEEYGRNALFKWYTAENSDKRACPCASTRKRYAYEEEEEDKLALFHSLALVESFLFKEVNEFT